MWRMTPKIRFQKQKQSKMNKSPKKLTTCQICKIISKNRKNQRSRNLQVPTPTTRRYPLSKINIKAKILGGILSNNYLLKNKLRHKQMRSSRQLEYRRSSLKLKKNEENSFNFLRNYKRTHSKAKMKQKLSNQKPKSHCG